MQLKNHERGVYNIYEKIKIAHLPGKCKHSPTRNPRLKHPTNQGDTTAAHIPAAVPGTQPTAAPHSTMHLESTQFTQISPPTLQVADGLQQPVTVAADRLVIRVDQHMIEEIRHRRNHRDKRIQERLNV